MYQCQQKVAERAGNGHANPLLVPTAIVFCPPNNRVSQSVYSLAACCRPDKSLLPGWRVYHSLGATPLTVYKAPPGAAPGTATLRARQLAAAFSESELEPEPERPGQGLGEAGAVVVASESVDAPLLPSPSSDPPSSDSFLLSQYSSTCSSVSYVFVLPGVSEW